MHIGADEGIRRRRGVVGKQLRVIDLAGQHVGAAIAKGVAVQIEEVAAHTNAAAIVLLPRSVWP